MYTKINWTEIRDLTFSASMAKNRITAKADFDLERLTNALPNGLPEGLMIETGRLFLVGQGYLDLGCITDEDEKYLRNRQNWRIDHPYVTCVLPVPEGALRTLRFLATSREWNAFPSRERLIFYRDSSPVAAVSTARNSVQLIFPSSGTASEE